MWSETTAPQISLKNHNTMAVGNFIFANVIHLLDRNRRIRLLTRPPEIHYLKRIGRRVPHPHEAGSDSSPIISPSIEPKANPSDSAKRSVPPLDTVRHLSYTCQTWQPLTWTGT